MDQLGRPVMVTLTRYGAALARNICIQKGLEWHARKDSFDLDYAAQGQTAAEKAPDTVFDQTTDHLQDLFAARRPIIGICSAGIIMRALSGLLVDKWLEPPVLAISDDGSVVIPLIGGHHGANHLARDLADITGGVAAISTTGDLRLGVSLDEPPAPFVLAQPDAARGVMATLNDGAKMRLIIDLPEELSALEHQWHDWLMPLSAQRDDTGGGVTLLLTMRPQAISPDQLVYYPRVASLGVGASRDCPPEELKGLVDDLLADHDLSPMTVDAVYSVDLKSDEPAVLGLAASLGRPARFYSAARLETETPRVKSPSDVVFDEIGTHSVAEAAALAAAGDQAVMLGPKRKTAHATAALAATPDAGKDMGMGSLPRGRVMLVGIGPGQSAWRTPEATSMIRAADELVGYHLYIDLLGAIATDKPRADYALGEEEARCRYALEEAGKGRAIAIICSGDAGIYAMGALVYELLDRDKDHGGVSAAARRVEVTSAPGVSALQAAAARSGALLGHDFCTISLSDLLTPWEHIENRITAAAMGDFVIAFYNPVSRRRRVGLAKARDILLGYRPADTPVVLASNLGRPEEDVRFRTLASLEVDEVDMLTVVMVGSSASRKLRLGMGDMVYTPRGYAKRIDKDKGEAS
jgi:cobalt-precorrin 5A hydrolase/precorrin-3B C17-methyltransferase